MTVPRNGGGLKAFRKKHGLSQTELGALLPNGGLSQPRVSAIETNKEPLTDEERAALRAWVRGQRGGRGGGGGGGPHVPRTGDRLKTWRKKRGMTQVQLANILDISQPFLSQIETNEWEVSPDARRRLRAWITGAGAAPAAVDGQDEDEEEAVELPWPVPRTGNGLENLLDRLTEEGVATLGQIARGTGVELLSLRQYTYLEKLPKRYIAKLRKFLAKHA